MRMPKPAVNVERRSDGAIVLTSPLPLAPARQSLAHIFDETAAVHPDRIFMRQRVASGGAWREINYEQARWTANGLAQWLIDQGVNFGDCVAYLSGPSIEHAIVAIGAQRAGASIAPLSVAYSLMSADHAKLRGCVEKCGARFVFVDDASIYGPAMRALASLDVRFVAARGNAEGIAVAAFDTVTSTPPSGEVARRMASITSDMIARVMYTSGSTGAPKATPQRQSNLTITVAQTEALGLLDFGNEAPQHLEAMPFSHIMAGNFNFNNVIRAGGTINIDEGKPIASLFHHTVANLREVSPHFFITVPLGYAMLCDAMETDAALRDSFFRNMRYIGFGGAVLPESVRDRLAALSRASRGEEVPIFSFYGATEYLFGTLKYWTGGRTDVIGLPLSGSELKLRPVDGRYELMFRGPTLMPSSGYIGDPSASAPLFDDEGFFRTGDAVTFANPSVPEEGLVFSGRIADDFKLLSGTFVSVNSLRLDLLAACEPLLKEAVICGLNQNYIGALLWLNEPAVREAAKTDSPDSTALAANPALRSLLSERIRAFNARQTGSSRRIRTAIIMGQPLSFDTNELTDKGNASPRVVHERRAVDVARLFSDHRDAEVLQFQT